MTIASPAAAADVPTRWLLLLLLCMPMIYPADAMLPREWKLETSFSGCWLRRLTPPSIESTDGHVERLRIRSLGSSGEAAGWCTILDEMAGFSLDVA